MNPPVSNYLSQTQTGFRMQDSQTFVKYPYKPAKRMYHGPEFRSKFISLKNYRLYGKLIRAWRSKYS